MLCPLRLASSPNPLIAALISTTPSPSGLNQHGQNPPPSRSAFCRSDRSATSRSLRLRLCPNPVQSRFRPSLLGIRHHSASAPISPLPRPAHVSAHIRTPFSSALIIPLSPGPTRSPSTISVAWVCLIPLDFGLDSLICNLLDSFALVGNVDNGPNMSENGLGKVMVLWSFYPMIVSISTIIWDPGWLISKDFKRPSRQPAQHARKQRVFGSVAPIEGAWRSARGQENHEVRFVRFAEKKEQKKPEERIKERAFVDISNAPPGLDQKTEEKVEGIRDQLMITVGEEAHLRE